jgi:hypothetical protein
MADCPDPLYPFLEIISIQAPNGCFTHTLNHLCLLSEYCH